MWYVAARGDGVDEVASLVGQVEAEDLELVVHVRVELVLRRAAPRRGRCSPSGFSFFSSDSSEDDASRIWLERASRTGRFVRWLRFVLAPELVELRELLGLERQAPPLRRPPPMSHWYAPRAGR